MHLVRVISTERLYISYAEQFDDYEPEPADGIDKVSERQNRRILRDPKQDNYLPPGSKKNR